MWWSGLRSKGAKLGLSLGLHGKWLRNLSFDLDNVQLVIGGGWISDFMDDFMILVEISEVLYLIRIFLFSYDCYYVVMYDDWKW